MKRCILIFGIIFLNLHLYYSQELYPLHEPASNLPKGVIGIHSDFEHFKEYDVERMQFNLKIMYGITANWEVEVQSDYSNHHSLLLPTNLITHTHYGNATYYYATPKVYGIEHPFYNGGLYLYSKYRFLVLDGEQEHLRAAFYAEFSTTKLAHDEAEPDLEGDTGGKGAGIVVTWLHKKFAASLTTGIILPNTYHESRFDYSNTFNGSHYYLTDLTYGNAVHYDLSLGYLLSPRHYYSYSDLNINLYAEFEGMTYGGATIIQNGIPIAAQTPFLLKGNYVDFYPSIQFIFNSNTRIDLSIGFNLFNRSYAHFYPVYVWGFQRYIFTRGRHAEPKTPKTL